MNGIMLSEALNFPPLGSTQEFAWVLQGKAF